MKCFGNKQELAIEYEIIGKEGYFEFWVKDIAVCCFYKEGMIQKYKWDLSYIVEWLIQNKQYILDEIDFPLNVSAHSSIEFLDISGNFDSDNSEEFYAWYEKRQDWYFRHSWYSNRAGSFLAEVLFRRVGNEIEIEWDNTELYKNVRFVNPQGKHYIKVDLFERILNEFLFDYSLQKK